MRSPENQAAVSPEDPRRLIHELQIHQIELEMQNEELRRTQAELEAEKIKYFKLYDLAPVGYCTVNEKGVILEANLIAAELLGQARSALLGKPLNRFILRQDLDIYDSHLKQLLQSSTTQSFDLRLQKKDRPIFWANLVATAVPDSSGAMEYRLILSDITKRRQAEDAVRESEFFFKESQRAGSIGSYKADLVAGVWESSEVLDAIFGIDQNCRRNNQVWRDMVHPDDKDTVNQYFHDEVIGRKKPFAKEYRIIKQNTAEVRWIYALGEVRFDDHGNALSMTGTIQDITERKQLEEELKKSQLLLAETEALGKVGGWEVNIDTGKQIWTDEVYKIHELDLPYVPTVDKGVNFYTPASRPLIERAVQRAIKYGEPYNLELEIITAKGNLRSVHAIGRADLEHRRVYGFFQDITGRKTLERELRKAGGMLQLKSDELHESNTALKVLLKQREQDKDELEEKIFANLEQLVFPHIKRLKLKLADELTLSLLTIIEANLKEIVSPFSRVLSRQLYRLSPQELIIANLVKEGRQDKEIAEILNLSRATIRAHRRHIREKLNIRGQKTNMRTYLSQLIK